MPSAFMPSPGAISAVELIKDSNDIEFVGKETQEAKTCEYVALLALFLGDPSVVTGAKDPIEANWEDLKKFLKLHTESEGLSTFPHQSSLGSYLKQNAAKFDFSEKTVQMAKAFVANRGTKLEGEQQEPVIRLVLPLLKEAMEHARAVDPEPRRKHAAAMKEKERFVAAKARIEALAKAMGVVLP